MSHETLLLLGFAAFGDLDVTKWTCVTFGQAANTKLAFSKIEGDSCHIFCDMPNLMLAG